MDSQNFNPKEFVDEVQDLCGYLDSELQIVQQFARYIGNQKELNQCIKHVKCLTNGLSRENIKYVFSWVFVLPLFICYEKDIKSRRDKKYLRLKKEQLNHYEKLKKAIELIKAENPDPSKFDEGYLLDLAQRYRRMYKVPPLSERPIRMVSRSFAKAAERFPGDPIMTSISEKKNPKGCYSINNFIYDVHKTVKETGLKDNAICVRLASLLTILTGKKYSRQNVQRILGHPVFIRGSRFRHIDTAGNSWPK